MNGFLLADWEVACTVSFCLSQVMPAYLCKHASYAPPSFPFVHPTFAARAHKSPVTARAGARSAREISDAFT